MNADQVMMQLAGLLRAGLPGATARAELEVPISAMPAGQREQFEAIWGLATRLGGSVAASIESLASSFLAQAKHSREVELAFAGPKATAKLVSVLPILGLVLAQLLGMNPGKAIFTNPIGFVSVALGGILMILGRVWAKAILLKAKPGEVDPGLFFDAIQIGLSAGLPLSQSTSEAIAALPSPGEGLLERVDHLAELTRRSGASISHLVRSAAHEARDAKRFQESEAIAKLSVRLMIPLGVVVLPAFVLMTIAPIAISLLSNGQNQ
jgi:tight adherence protein B